MSGCLSILALWRHLNLLENDIEFDVMICFKRVGLFTEKDCSSAVLTSWDKKKDFNWSVGVGLCMAGWVLPVINMSVQEKKRNKGSLLDGNKGFKMSNKLVISKRIDP